MWINGVPYTPGFTYLRVTSLHADYLVEKAVELVGEGWHKHTSIWNTYFGFQQWYRRETVYPDLSIYDIVIVKDSNIMEFEKKALAMMNDGWQKYCKVGTGMGYHYIWLMRAKKSSGAGQP